MKRGGALDDFAHERRDHEADGMRSARSVNEREIAEELVNERHGATDILRGGGDRHLRNAEPGPKIKVQTRLWVIPGSTTSCPARVKNGAVAIHATSVGRTLGATRRSSRLKAVGQ